MNDDRIVSIAQLSEFAKLTKGINFTSINIEEKYKWVDKTLTKFKYFSLNKKEKGIIQEYIREMTGLSRSQTNILIDRKKKTGKVYKKKRTQPKFQRKYRVEDVALLVETDNAHGRMSGPATKKILKDEYDLYGDEKYKNIKDISVSHIYNLRGTRQYSSHSTTFTKTQTVQRDIGIREKPDAKGKPGYVRVDTVHQGDKDEKKGVYHINLVDETLQWEVLVCVEKISEHFLAPALEEALEQFPFVIKGFHSDNGSEYLNKVVAKLLEKLRIRQTKSRSRHCNDNALVEGKNASAIRKNMGRNYIAKKNAGDITKFYRDYLNPYLNFHRPCGFATEKVNGKGKIKKVYRKEDYKTPYQKLCSLDNPEQYLKKGVTMRDLEEQAFALSHTEAAKLTKEAKNRLFNSFKN